ncbi:MAG TPA: lytic transglycosylase F [Myxococcaceae bacterium]|nr:lytic transglycosylase F [Myxococcaceae bacterium]
MVVSQSALRWMRTAVLVGGACASAVLAQTPPRVGAVEALSLETVPRTGDLDVMLEHRVIRVLVPYSRTLFFNDRGQERGITADVAREFERSLNLKYRAKLGKRPVTVVLIATTRDQLLPRLAEGLGDIAAGNLTVTSARREQADFVPQTGRDPVHEVVVTGPSSPPLSSLEELSGKVVTVRASSSYAESLAELNGRLRVSGRDPVKIEYLPEELEDEDAMEMLQAGAVELTVVDRWKARIWASVLPGIRVREDLSLRDEGQIGWAIRHGSPLLSAELTRFFVATSRNWGGFNSRIISFHRRIHQITSNATTAGSRRFAVMAGLFEKYGLRYGFDPLMLTAQAFQESKLRQEARSHVGALGVMQVMPATGAEMAVGDVRQLEPNIHAGTKYLNQLLTRYLPDASFDAVNRPLFAFASYNAGPGAVSGLRRLAERRGLDRDRWFNHVEVVAAEKIGLETTTYVRNIYKYYVAYKLGHMATQAGEAARKKAAADWAWGSEEGPPKATQ